MKYLNAYINRVGSKNPDLAKSIETTAEKFQKKCLNDFDYSSEQQGLLFGNVQSGKTGQMLGILCQSADEGFPIFIVLTTDNKVLQEQTYKRIKDELPDFAVYSENDSKLFTADELEKPAVIVLKKNARILKLWSNVLKNSAFTAGNPILILDDEGDAASLNTLVNQNRTSSINRYLNMIRKNGSCSIYLSVTGTPQALFLQTLKSKFNPSWSLYFQPGKSYLGGDFFFPESGKSHAVITESSMNAIPGISHQPDELERSVLHHLAAAGILFADGIDVSNYMAHPGTTIASHRKTEKQISDTLKKFDQLPESEFDELLRFEYDRIKPEKCEKPDFETVKAAVQKLLKNKEYRIIVMNSKSQVSSEEYSKGCNFIIGGNSLGRGVTFPSLQTVYYTRSTKKPQADTMWQHNRMFGYDRDPGMIKVYMDDRLKKLFTDINTSNNSIISQIEKGAEAVRINLSEELQPTRKNVLDNEAVNIIPGGTNFFPYDLENDSIEDLNKLLSSFSSDEPFYKVSLRTLISIFSHIKETGSSFPVDSYVEILKTQMASSPTEQGILIVRRNRDVAQGTGALLSPNDLKIGKDHPDQTVLTMYQVTGIKGWRGQTLWVPNIKFPVGKVYYQVDEPENG